MFEKTENKRKRGRGWPIFFKKKKKKERRQIKTITSKRVCSNLGIGLLNNGKIELANSIPFGSSWSKQSLLY